METHSNGIDTLQSFDSLLKFLALPKKKKVIKIIELLLYILILAMAVA